MGITIPFPDIPASKVKQKRQEQREEAGEEREMDSTVEN